MSSAEGSSGKCSEDLLLAALDQSGLTDFGSSLFGNIGVTDSSAGTSGLTCQDQKLAESRQSPTPQSDASVGNKNRYARVTVGGRKFLIPIGKHAVVPPLKEPSKCSGQAGFPDPLELVRTPQTFSGTATLTSVFKTTGRGKNSESCGFSGPLIEPPVHHTNNHPDPVSIDSPVPKQFAATKDFSSYGTENPDKIMDSQIRKSKQPVTADMEEFKVFLTEKQFDLEEEEESDNERIISTYADYKPSKLTVGLPHPDPVVETSSLSSILPPDVHYKLSIPQEAINKGCLSALQLESITYACQKHQQLLPGGERAGFLIGDGAGVGKGRTIAGIIYENYLLGRKRSLWFSVSNDLKYDCERDLHDIGAKSIQVHTLSKFKYGKISSRENSSVKKGVIFATYSSLISESHSDSKYGSRLKQILHWCGTDFDGVIIFDECHKAKNLVPAGSTKSTKTGFAVMELQRKLPNARVVYASATGASEPRNMAYMARIGLWGSGTPFFDFDDFIQAVERRGVGAMELVAMDLKSRGSYIARQLSFQGVSFRIDEVLLSDSFIEIYNQAVRLWVAAKEAFQVAADVFGVECHMKKTMWGQFWAAHQRFFKYLCIAAKVERASLISREAVKHGKCVVIGLQSTGEARTLDQLEKSGGELEDFVSTARGVFQNLVEQHFPAPNRKRITDLFGEDFYRVNENSAENKKLKKPSPRKTSSTTQKRLHSAQDPLSDSSGDSIDYSDEDITKIFGAESDSEDWGNDESSQQKRGRDDPDTGIKREQMFHLPFGHNVDQFVKTGSGTGKAGNCSKTVLAALNLDNSDPMAKVQAIKHELLEKIERLELPNNSLDDLIDGLGGSENVAEMTGRKGRVILSEEGFVQYQSRAEREVSCSLLNMTEKQRFMNGEKNIAIISDAASSGISLQSDRRVRNQRRRLHITLELPWSADRAIQQFGRTHRSNQVNAPEYLFLITELAGERRFASVIAKRLESLGALTHGDRRATETRDFSRFNFDNKHGRIALDAMMRSVIGVSQPLTAVPSNYPGDFFAEIQEAMRGVGLISSESQNGTHQLEKARSDSSCSIGKFLNRILGIEVIQQNAVFRYFCDTLSAIVNRAKAEGHLDQGIKDVGSREDIVEHVDTTRFELNSKVCCHGDGPGANTRHVELHTVKVDRGLSWERAQVLHLESSVDMDDGFHLSRSRRNGNFAAVLIISDSKDANSSKKKKLQIESKPCIVYRPNTGKQTKEEYRALRVKFEKASADEARKWWIKQYEESSHSCSHMYLQGYCHSRYLPCTAGKRLLTYRILSGSVLAVWKMVEQVLTEATSRYQKIQIVRFTTKDGRRLAGLLIPENCADKLIQSLQNCYDLFSHQRSMNSSRKSVIDTHWKTDMADVPVKEEADEDFSPDEFVSSVLFPTNHGF